MSSNLPALRVVVVRSGHLIALTWRCREGVRVVALWLPILFRSEEAVRMSIAQGGREGKDDCKQDEAMKQRPQD